MKSKYIILSIISVLLMAVCSTETGRTLRHADSVMEESPDSAFAILKGIDRRVLKTSDLPYYALLYTQAQVKTDVPLDSDSLISIAYSKYGADTRGDLGIRSNFYTGEVFFNQEKYREAMRYYLTAYEESKRLTNDYWHAKAAERISNVMFFSYKYDDAMKYAQEAAWCYNSASRTRNNRFALAQLANVMINNGYPDRAYTLLDSLMVLSLQDNLLDTTFIDYIRLPLMDAAIQTGHSMALESDNIDFLSDNMSEGELLDAAIFQSHVHADMEDHDKVEALLEVVSSFAHSDEDKIHLLYAKYENAKYMGNLTQAIALVDSMLYYQNAVAEDIVKESVTGAQRDFYSQMAIRHQDRVDFLKWMIVLGGIIFVLVIVGMVVFFILRNKAKSAKLQAQLEGFMSLKIQSENNLRENLSLKEIVQEIGHKNESMSNKIQELQNATIGHNEIIEKLFREKWNTLDKLCDQYHGLGNSELTAKDLVANLQKEVKKVVSKKGLMQIVDAVDLYMGGVVTALRTQCPFLKEADINFLALLYAGFTTRAVCMFIDIKYDYFYVKKSRLIKRLEASDAPDKSLFLQKLK